MSAQQSRSVPEATRAGRARFTRPIVAAALFTAGYLAAAGIGAAATGNGEFLFYILTMLVMIAVLLWAHWRVRFSDGVIWLMAIWGALHMAGGLVPVPSEWAQGEGAAVLYSLWLVPPGSASGWLKYDQAVHALGFGVMTWLCWQGLQAATRPARPSGGLMLLCATAAMGFGAVNEIIEFIATRLGPTNVGGYVNTALDLVANAVGATIAAVAIAVSGSRRRDA
jgi:uncharacterized membrane protein YjdF